MFNQFTSATPHVHSWRCSLSLVFSFSRIRSRPARTELLPLFRRGRFRCRFYRQSFSNAFLVLATLIVRVVLVVIITPSICIPQLLLLKPRASMAANGAPCFSLPRAIQRLGSVTFQHVELVRSRQAFLVRCVLLNVSGPLTHGGERSVLARAEISAGGVLNRHSKTRELICGVDVDLLVLHRVSLYTGLLEDRATRRRHASNVLTLAERLRPKSGRDVSLWKRKWCKRWARANLEHSSVRNWMVLIWMRMCVIEWTLATLLSTRWRQRE